MQLQLSNVPQKGSRGNIVASRNRFGPFERDRVSPDQPGTPAQRDSWWNMTEPSRLWNEITDQPRLAWRRRAAETHGRPSLGQSGPLDGCQLFKKINRGLATCGRQPLLDLPPLPRFGPNPADGFTISNGKHGPVFKLRMSRAAGSDPRPPLEDIMIFSWAPCNAGADKNDLYSFLCHSRLLSRSRRSRWLRSSSMPSTSFGCLLPPARRASQPRLGYLDYSIPLTPRA